MIQTNRIAIDGISRAERSGPLDPYENTDLNIHLNSYYVQLRGALDNLAWSVHYEASLLGSGDEDDPKVQRQCHLFGKEFQKALQDLGAVLAADLATKGQWAGELKAFRDPVVHRVPLYAASMVITSQADVDHFKALDAEAAALDAVGNFSGAAAKREEARRVGAYQPLFTTSGVDQVKPWSIPERIALDQENFFDICESVLRFLFPDPNARVGF